MNQVPDWRDKLRNPGCELCALHQGADHVCLMGGGKLNAKVMIVGEAPGQREDETHRAFVGPAGKLLDATLAEYADIKRDDCYVTNIAKCLSGQTRVQLGDGSWEKISKLVTSRYAGEVMSVTSSGKIVKKPVTGWYSSPREYRKLIKVSYKNAERAGPYKRGAIVTEDHEFLTHRGWIQAQYLKDGVDQVAVGQGLPSITKEVITGTLLGDAHLHQRTSLQFSHTNRHQEYTAFKAQLLQPLEACISTLQVNDGTGKYHKVCRYRSLANRAVGIYGSKFYNGNHRGVPSDIKLTPLTLAIWFMDDGHCRQKPPRQPNAEIAAHSFTVEEQRILKQVLLRDLDLHVTINHKRIRFNVEETIKLSRIIAAYVPSVMRYKLVPNVEKIIPFREPVTTSSSITEWDTVEVTPFTVKKTTRTKNYSYNRVFCLDIKDTHNFVTSAGVAHNCRPPSNRTPELKEIKACSDTYFWLEVARVKPEFMLLLGNSALRGVMKKSGITKQSGSVWPKVFGQVPVQVMATLHPAAILRNPKYGATFVADITRFGRLVRGEKQAEDTQVKIITKTSQLKWLISQLMKAEEISYDIETHVVPGEPPMIRTGFQDWHGKDSQIVSIAFSWQEGSGACVPLYHTRTPWRDPGAVLRALAPTLVRADAKYIGHNAKFDSRWLHSKGVPVRDTFDTMLACHMLEENRPKGLKPLSRTLLNKDAYDVGEDLGNAHTMDLRRLCIYNTKDTDYTLQLYHLFREQLKKQPRTARIFMKLMMPASNALVDIERHGVWIDPERWEERHEKAQENVAKLYQYVNRYVSEELRPINLRSPPQVAKWLFEDLEFPVVERTKTGAPSSKEAVILELASQYDHPALKALLKYRKWAKFLSTYLLPWKLEHMDRNGRIHSNYKLFGTVTGRLSGEGGIQQVPRDPFIRSIIGAPPGWKFLQADYSQVELRIAAMEAREETMLSQYMRGEDIHMARAMRMTGKPKGEITKEERKKAKSVSFGFLYGMGSPKFVKYAFENYDVRVTPAEAEAARRGFFNDYPNFLKWHERQRRLARRYGMVQSRIGRVRHLPDIVSQDEKVRGDAERQAINSPVQSMASDMMLAALVKLHHDLDPAEAVVVGTVHDSILFEVRDDCTDAVATQVKETMQDIKRIERMFSCEITVPIICDIEIGQHWAEGKEWLPA